MKKSFNLANCAECGARLSQHAESCPECGYPHLARSTTGNDASDSPPASREYRILQLAGLAVLAVGIAAAAADAPFAAGVAIAAGAAAYLSGLLGAWWNRPG